MFPVPTGSGSPNVGSARASASQSRGDSGDAGRRAAGAQPARRTGERLDCGRMEVALALGGWLNRLESRNSGAKEAAAAAEEAAAKEAAATIHREHEEELLLGSVRRIHSWAKRTQATVAKLFAEIDADGSGSIDVSEFRRGAAELGLKFTNEETTALVKHMDADGDGVLDTNEFCKRMTEMLEAEASSGPVILSTFLLHLHTNDLTAAKLFADRDLDSSGTLDVAEFHALLETIGITVSDTAARAAMAELDLDGVASLEIDEVLSKLTEYARARRVFAATVLGGVCDYLESTKTSVVRLFARVDADGSGTLDVLELQEAMRKMKQNLSELEVEEIMRELAHGSQEEGTAGSTDMTCWQFLDKLKQFKKEHQAYSDKCRRLFNEADGDSSEYLEPTEVLELAKKMGLAELLADPSSNLTLEKLIADIESSRASKEAARWLRPGGTAVVDTAVPDGYVTFDELLPWFLNVGRSYLPPPIYSSVAELDEPSVEELEALFAGMDHDGSGEIEKAEAIDGTLLIYPYVDIHLVEKAFEAADDDGSGRLQFDEFDELLRCLQFLNKRRHEISELIENFESSGVGQLEFYMCLVALGMQTSDSEATDIFDVECVRLGVLDGVLTVHQFILWVCRKECIDKSTAITEEAAIVAKAQEELESCMTDFGDIYFEDLAKVVFTQAKRKPNAGSDDKPGHAMATTTSSMSKWRHAAKEASVRLTTLTDGIQLALERHEAFPALKQETIRQLVLQAETDIYYSGQHLITQGMYEEEFFIIRRGAAQVLVDGEVRESVRAGEPLGELALMYGTKHSVTIRTTGPIEVFRLDRSSYETTIASLPEEEQQGRLMKILQRFWLLVTGPDGSKRPEVDYAVYLKYHNRVTKTLMSQDEATNFDDDEQREIALEDWGEDCTRFGLSTTGVLTAPMFFDSIYQMVELWAGDLKLSFVGFLELLFDNIAVWEDEPPPGHWRFQSLDEVSGAGEQLEIMQAEAKQAMEVEALKRQQEAAEAERQRIEADEKARLRREKMRELHELRLAEQQKAAIAAEEAELSKHIENLLQKIDDGDEDAKAEYMRAQKDRLGLMAERMSHEETLTDQNDEEAQQKLADAKAEMEEAALEAEALFDLLNEDAAAAGDSHGDHPRSPQSDTAGHDGRYGALSPRSMALVEAVLAGDEVLVRQFLSEGCDANTVSKGWPVLALASQRGYVGIVHALVDSGAHVDQTLLSNATSLIVASDAGRSDCVAALLSLGANANAARADGATSLHMAAAKGHPKVVTLLLGHDADPEAVDGNGGTALAIASHNGNQACTRLLRRAVAERWKQGKLAEWGMGSESFRAAESSSGQTVRLPQIIRPVNASKVVAAGSILGDTLRGPQTAVGGLRRRRRPPLQTPAATAMPTPPRTARRGKRNNAPTRKIWTQNFEAKPSGSASSSKRTRRSGGSPIRGGGGGSGGVEKQLSSVVGSTLAGALDEIVRGICGEAQQFFHVEEESGRMIKPLSVGHLRLLHRNLQGGSIVLEAVRSRGGRGGYDAIDEEHPRALDEYGHEQQQQQQQQQQQTVAVRVVALKASHSGAADPCIICLGFRGPLDVMHFGSPSYRWDPEALEETVDAARAACREHAMVQIVGRQAVSKPSVALNSRLVAFHGHGQVQFSGARTKTVLWQYERRLTEAIEWLRGGQ